MKCAALDAIRQTDVMTTSESPIRPIALVTGPTVAQAYDPQARRRLAEVSARLAGLDHPES